MNRGRLVASLAYGAALLAVVLSPISYQLNRLTVRLYVVWLYDLRLPGNPSPEDFGAALNVLLFVPVGFLLVRLTRWSWLICALVCVTLSGAVEAAQWLLLAGRQASLGDVAANAAGGLIGALLATYAVRKRGS